VVAREVGHRSKLGGQATVPASPARGRTDRHSQRHGRQLDEQVRGIVKVVTAVADGDLHEPDC